MEVRSGAKELESGVVPRYLTTSSGLDGFSHSLTLLQAAIDNMAVFPEPPAPYKTKGLVDGPELAF